MAYHYSPYGEESIAPQRTIRIRPVLRYFINRWIKTGAYDSSPMFNHLTTYKIQIKKLFFY